MDSTYEVKPVEGLRGVMLNRIQYPILQFIDGTILTNPRFFKKIYDGYGFSVSHRFDDVASDGVVQVWFENPNNSKREIYIIVVEIVSTGRARADVYRNNTKTSSGTELTPVNLNLGSSISSVINVEYNGAYTLGNLVHNTVIPGGSHIRAIGSVVEVGESVIIPEGYNLIIQVINKSTSAEDISIRILWFEEEVS